MVVKKTRKPRKSKSSRNTQKNTGKGPNININIDQSKTTRGRPRAATADSNKKPTQAPIIVNSYSQPNYTPPPIFNFPLPTNLNPFDNSIRESQKYKVEETPNDLEKPKAKPSKSGIQIAEEDDMPDLVEETEAEKVKRLFKGQPPPLNPFKSGLTGLTGVKIGKSPTKTTPGPPPKMSFAEELKASVGGTKLKKSKNPLSSPGPPPKMTFAEELKGAVEGGKLRKSKNPLPTPSIFTQEIPRENTTPLEETQKETKPTIINISKPKVRGGSMTMQQLINKNTKDDDDEKIKGENLQLIKTNILSGGYRLGGSGDSIINRLNREELNREELRRRRVKALEPKKTIIIKSR